MEPEVLVVGVGEIGKPLAELLRRDYRVATKDVEPSDVTGIDVMHVCYPFQIPDFVGTTAGYVRAHSPHLVIVNSTVLPGTSRQIEDAAGVPVVYSPVRGKHSKMLEDMSRYAKFVAGTSEESTAAARKHFEKVGVTVRQMGSPEALELAKLVETSYFGVLLAWAQEVDRLSTSVGADYEEVQGFLEEIPFLPDTVFLPGFIGGHCVIPNSHLLDQVAPSLLMEAMRRSNELKAEEWGREGRDLEERLTPRRR